MRGAMSARLQVALQPGEHARLAGAEAGEHYFLVCVLGDGGELCHAIPHRYMMSTDGRLAHGFDGLKAQEREDSSRIEELDIPTAQELKRYDEFVARALSANLPPPRTVPPLLAAVSDPSTGAPLACQATPPAAATFLPPRKG